MTNANDVRRAHEILDDISIGNQPNQGNLEHLRSFLPELPKQKTLEEILEEVKEVWGATVSSYWPEDTHGSLETWLWELHKQLEGLKGTAPETSQASPGLPEGMRMATHPEYGLCVVAPVTDEDGERRIFYLCNTTETGADCRWVPVVHLTFLDEKAASPELPEDEEPHPEFLETKADYQNAPEGTIVAEDKKRPAWKPTDVWFINSNPFDNGEMAGTPLRVLRWGNGNE